MGRRKSISGVCYVPTVNYEFVVVVMVRIATVRDAEQLSVLNNEFNGKDETTIDNIRNSIINNKQEVVIVADKIVC